MPTIKQKRAFKELGVNGGNISKAMRAAGYSPSASKRTDKLTRTKGWEELIEKHLSDRILAKKHHELLNKKEKIVVGVGKGFSAIEDTGQPHSDAVKALDMAYKLKRKYGDDQGVNKTLVVVVAGETSQRYAIPSIAKDSSNRPPQV